MNKPLKLKLVLTLVQKDQDKRDAVIADLRARGLPEQIADNVIYRIGLDYAMGEKQENKTSKP